jgi:phage FluMu gp28-like protein
MDGSTTDLIEADDLPDVFLPSQQKFMRAVDENRVVVVEKSRRIGFSWSAAAVATLYAAASRDAGGMDVYYMAYDKEVTREFIGYCTDWAKALERAASEVEESFFEDPENPDKLLLKFRITFSSGFEIVGLPSVARTLRSKQGLVIIDEAAFADKLDEIIKAAMAYLIWGGKVVIISTHKGTDNPFNELVNDIRAGKKPYALMRVTLDDAIGEGLYKRICTKLGQEWTPEGEAKFRADIIADYGTDADEELFCIPTAGSGAYLSGALIEARMEKEIPVIRLEKDDSFMMMAEHLRIAEIKDFCESELLPVLNTLKADRPHVFGQDFARIRDLSVFMPFEITKTLTIRTPFVLEMRNVPYEAQKQVVFYIIDRLPRFRAGKFDAGGNGGYLAEVSIQKYGDYRIEAVMLTESWYRENMPKYRARFDDGTIVLPLDSDIKADHRLLKLIRGVGRIPEERTGIIGKKRHGDSAIAGALGEAAARADVEEFGYEPAPARRVTADYGAEDYYRTAEEADRAQDDAERNDAGFMPALTRRVY